MTEAKLLCFDVESGQLSTVTCNTIEDYHKYLKCDVFDITTRIIGGKVFDVYCDDEGLFKENIVVSAVDSKFTYPLVGNLIFALHDRQGNTVSLSEDDIAVIRSCCIECFNPHENELQTIIYPCEICA